MVILRSSWTKDTDFIHIKYIYSGSQSIVLVYVGMVASTTMSVDSYSYFRESSVELNSKHARFPCPAVEDTVWMHAEIRPHFQSAAHTSDRFTEAHSFQYIPSYNEEFVWIAQLNKKISFCSAQTINVSFMNESVDGYSSDKNNIHFHECHFKDKALRISFFKRDMPHF